MLIIFKIQGDMIPRSFNEITLNLLLLNIMAKIIGLLSWIIFQIPVKNRLLKRGTN